MNGPNEYRNEMNKLHFTEEQKEHMAENLVRQQQKAAGVRVLPRKKKYLRTAAIAAALAAVLTVTAGAAGVLKPVSQALAGVFDMNAAETEIVDKIGRPVGASDTDGGLTITADAVIGDGNNLCVVYTLEWEDGQEPEAVLISERGDLGLMFEDNMIDIGENIGWHGSRRFLNETPNDGKITLVEEISPDQPVNGRVLKADFENICAFDQNGDPQLVTKGNWNLKFKLEYEDAGVELVTSEQKGRTFQYEGAECTVESISISPVGFRVEWSLPKTGNEELMERSNWLLHVPVSMTLTDGTVLELTGGASMHFEGDTARADRSDILPRILPLEEVASVTVGDVVFPMA